MSKPPTDFLINNGWPEAGVYDTTTAAKLKYLEHVKHEIRVALEKAKSGGKKGKGGKNAAPVEEAPKESCIMAIGSQYPQYQQQVLQILSAQEWTDNKVIVGQEYIAQVRQAITNKKE